MEHNISCIILSISEQLFNLGLRDLLKKGVERILLSPSCREKSSLTSKALCSLCNFILVKQANDILASIDKMIIERDLKHNDFSSFINENVIGSLFNEGIRDIFTMELCDVKSGLHGRMIQSNFGIGRGSIVINESPICSVKVSKCHCQNSPILNEYITLSWALAWRRHCDIHSSQFKTSFSNEQREKYKNFMKTFRTGLNEISLEDVVDELEAEINESNTDMHWSFETQALMAIISCVCSLYTKHTFQMQMNTDYNHHCDTDLFEFDPFSMFEIIARLPTNIHAVFTVTSTAPAIKIEKNIKLVNKNNVIINENLIEQRRIGYSVFLQASSINHSCAPNCTLRYHFTLPELVQVHEGGPIDITTMNSLDVLNSMSIEILPVKSIHSGSELTISYGPMAGRHALNTRQNYLKSHFLFNCRCEACKQELEYIKNNNENKQIFKHEEVDIDTENYTTHVSESLHFCHELSRLKEDVTCVNTEVTEMLNLITTTTSSSHKSNHRNFEYVLEGFESKKIIPIKNDLMSLKARHIDGIENVIENFISSIFLQKISEKKNKKKTQFSCDGEKRRYRPGSPEYGLYREFCGLYSVILDIQGRLLAQRAKFLEAARCVEEAVFYMVDSMMYADDDVAIGRERLKISQLLFSGGDLINCSKFLQQAMSNMRPFISQDDPDWIEAKLIESFILRKGKT